MMNKFKITFCTFILSVLTFAQNHSGKIGSRPDDGYTENDFGDLGGGQLASSPIDNYTILLIAIAILMIGYVVYKKRQTKLA